MQKNENPVVLSAVLLVISLVVALLLAFTNAITADKIEQNTINEQNAAKQEVLPVAATFEEADASQDETGIVKAVFEGKDASGATVGWCANVTPSGYGGEIDLMVGILSDGTISGIQVVSHAETPGLGAKASESSFSSQFAGKKTDEPLAVIYNGTPIDSEIVSISGATITITAVKDGVNAAAETVKKLNGGV